MWKGLIKTWNLVLLQSVLSFDRINNVLRHAEGLGRDVVDSDVVEEREELNK